MLVGFCQMFTLAYRHHQSLDTYKPQIFHFNFLRSSANAPRSQKCSAVSLNSAWVKIVNKQTSASSKMVLIFSPGLKPYWCCSTTRNGPAHSPSEGPKGKPSSLEIHLRDRSLKSNQDYNVFSISWTWTLLENISLCLFLFLGSLQITDPFRTSVRVSIIFSFSFKSLHFPS